MHPVHRLLVLVDDLLVRMKQAADVDEEHVPILPLPGLGSHDGQVDLVHGHRILTLRKWLSAVRH